MAKKSKKFIQKNRHLDFTKDGMFKNFRIKEKDKAFLRKQRRLFEKRVTKQEIDSI